MNELEVDEVVSELDDVLSKLSQGLHLPSPRIINLLKQQSAELEATRKEIERLTYERDVWRDKQKIKRIPEGWQLVPIEPTDDMLHEMRDTTLDYELDDLEERRMSKSPFNAVYKAMLKSAPKPEDE
ncbi:MAG: hypothetical protein KGI50_08220 [Patescibacteria group bacterium]|nr:hypothetical protein [Patescibacteria group bacterium]